LQLEEKRVPEGGVGADPYPVPERLPAGCDRCPLGPVIERGKGFLFPSFRDKDRGVLVQLSQQLLPIPSACVVPEAIDEERDDGFAISQHDKIGNREKYGGIDGSEGSRRTDNGKSICLSSLLPPQWDACEIQELEEVQGIRFVGNTCGYDGEVLQGTAIFDRNVGDWRMKEPFNANPQPFQLVKDIMKTEVRNRSSVIRGKDKGPGRVAAMV
jgi:hypothetical protein